MTPAEPMAHWSQYPPQHQQPPFARADDKMLLEMFEGPFAWGSLEANVRLRYQRDILTLKAAGVDLTINGLTRFIERGIAMWKQPGRRGLGVGRAQGMRSAIHELYVVYGWDQPSGENDRLNATINALQRVVNALIKSHRVSPKVDYGAMTHSLLDKHFLPKARAMAKTEDWRDDIGADTISGFIATWSLGLRISEVQYILVGNFDDVKHLGEKRWSYVTLNHKQSESRQLKTSQRIVGKQYEQFLRKAVQERLDDGAEGTDKLFPSWNKVAACRFFSAVTDAMIAANPTYTEGAGRGKRTYPCFPAELRWTTHSLRNGAANDVWEATGERSQVQLRTGHADTMMIDLYKRSNRRRLQDRTARITIKSKKGVMTEEELAAQREIDAEEATLPSAFYADENDFETDDEVDDPGDDVGDLDDVDDDFTSPFAGHWTATKVSTYITKWRAKQRERGMRLPRLRPLMTALIGTTTGRRARSTKKEAAADLFHNALFNS